MDDTNVWSPASDPPTQSALLEIADLWIQLGKDLIESAKIVRAWKERERTEEQKE